MHIKPDKNAYIFVLICFLCLVAVCIALDLRNASLGFISLFFIVPTIFIILPFSIAICRDIKMDKMGCKVRFLFISRFYSWQQLTTRKHEVYMRVNFKSPYDEAVIFSPHRICKPKWMKPLEYVFFTFPGWFFFVHFIPSQKELFEDRINRFPLLCCVDKDEFYKKMAEWNISIDE